MTSKTSSKISIIGSGFVGATISYTLMMSELVSEIVLVDIDKEKAEGDAMDMSHGVPFLKPVEIIAGDYKDCSGSNIVIVTAGAGQKPGETRMANVKKNVEIFKNIIPQITKYCKDSIILIVSNPVDILTYTTYKISGLPSNKIIGSGTVLDTSRFKYLLSKHTKIDSRNIHGYIIGEHGDTEVAAWSRTYIAGMTMDDFCSICKKCEGYSREKIFEDVKNSAYRIIEKKTATYYAISLAVKKIVECILRNENSILTVSSIIHNKYGIDNVCLSLPTIVNKNGIDKILEVPLNNSEINLLKKSASILKNIINEVNI